MTVKRLIKEKDIVRGYFDVESNLCEYKGRRSLDDRFRFYEPL